MTPAVLYVVPDDSQSVVTLTSDLDLLSHQLYSRTAADQKFNNCNSIFVLGQTLAIVYILPKIALGQNFATTSAGKKYLS